MKQSISLAWATTILSAIGHQKEAGYTTKVISATINIIYVASFSLRRLTNPMLINTLCTHALEHPAEKMHATLLQRYGHNPRHFGTHECSHSADRSLIVTINCYHKVNCQFISLHQLPGREMNRLPGAGDYDLNSVSQYFML